MQYNVNYDLQNEELPNKTRTFDELYDHFYEEGLKLKDTNAHEYAMYMCGYMVY